MSDNMKFLADALAYHTKGRKAFMESKCSCCNNDPCDCPDDCDCKSKMDEATDKYHKHMLKALGKTRLPKNHGYTSSIANNGDFVVRDGGGRTAGRIGKDDHNLSEGADEVNDKNINAVHDKDEGEATDNTVKMTNDIIAGKQPYTKPIKSIYEPVKEDLDELLGHAEDLYEMVMELDEMLKEEDMSLSEAFHALSEDLDEDMLDEDFAKMSKTKQMIARRKAGRRKKLTVGYKLNKNKLNIPNKPK